MNVTSRSSSTILAADPDDLRARFFKLATRREVAELLDVPYWQLDWLLRRSPVGQRYRELTIAKRRGGARLLLAPSPSLRILQRKLLQVLSAVYRPRSCVLGFTNEGGIKKNAIAHVGRRWVINVDLVDFFPSIHFGRVAGMLSSPPYRLPVPAATTIAQICCHNGVLPQGAPTSPIISNMVCAKLDGELVRLAARSRASYTRYADDLTFSTWRRSVPPTIATESAGRLVLGDELRRLIQQNSFAINESKVRICSKAARQEVTGVVVNKFANTPRRFSRQIRAMLHAWEKYGLDAAQSEFSNTWDRKHRSDARSPEFPRVLRGKIQHLEHIRGRRDVIVQNMWRRYARLEPSAAFRVAQSWRDIVRAAMWVVETGAYQGTGFHLREIGLVTCEHIVGADSIAFHPDRPHDRRALKVMHKCDKRDLALADIGLAAEPALELAADFSDGLGAEIFVAGYANYREGDTGTFSRQTVIGRRVISTTPHIQTSGPIVGGMSGGPVVTDATQVVGTSSPDPVVTERRSRPRLGAWKAIARC